METMTSAKIRLSDGCYLTGRGGGGSRERGTSTGTLKVKNGDKTENWK